MNFGKYFFFIFVFITGTAIMMLEMAAFRLVTPYFGASLFVWANIIGLVMIGLSIGYYFGGRLADLRPERKILMRLVLISGILVSFIPLVSSLCLSYFVRLSNVSPFFESIIFSSFLFVALLFLVPLTLLGAVSPFVIRLYNKELETTGYSSGTIYAFSTVGSIFGTFFASFLTIPLLGTRETILISAFSLILISLFGSFKNIKKPLFLFLLLPFLLNFDLLNKREGLVYEKESFYGLIQVLKSEKLGYILDINRSGRWSVYHPEKVLTGMYFDYFTPLYFLLDKREDLDILIIGHAGGTISRQYSHFLRDRNLKIDGIELDPEVTRAARLFFNLAEQQNLKVINADGRIYLAANPKKYDLVLIDAYTSDLYIPYQLTTKNFFDLIKSRLKDEGILATMIISEDPQKERVFQYISQTIKSVYPYSYYFPSESRTEHFVIASKISLNDKLTNLKERTDIDDLKEISSDISQNFLEIRRSEKKRLLSDNWAPTELLRELDKFSRGLSSF